MDVQLSADRQAFLRVAMEAGRLRGEEDAIEEALQLWEERERLRAGILSSVDQAEASQRLGYGREITEESMRQLASDVKQRGRARLAAEQGG